MKRIFQIIVGTYSETKRDLIESFEKDGMPLKGGLCTKIYLAVGGICEVLCKFTYYPFTDFIIKRKFSPFIKEWILACTKWIYIGPLFFVVALLISFLPDLMEMCPVWRIETAKIFLGYVSLSIIVLVTLLMPTPRRELEDALFRYRLRRRKKVMIGSLRSFRTTFEINTLQNPQSYLYDLSPETDIIFPMRLFCMELPEGHIPRSFAPAYDVQLTTEWPIEGDNIDDDNAEISHPIFLNFAETEETLRQCKIRVKAAFPAEAIDWFIELTKKEPSMEFEVEYLFFSKLLTGIYPIEGYDYPEGVTELLEKLNRSVNPWIKK